MDTEVTLMHQKGWERIIKDERKMKAKLFSSKDWSDVLTQ